MKKIVSITLTVLLFVIMAGFTYNEPSNDNFNVNDLYDYQKEYKSEDAGVCALGKTKTYMDYRSVTDPSSVQYRFIRDYMTVDENSGFLLDEDGFIGVALGSYYGVIGDRYYFTLDSGVVLPVVKIDEKADKHTDPTGCYHSWDGSVIEFVIDKDYANEFYGYYNNGLVLSGNFSNYRIYKGSITKVEKVLEDKRDDYVTYVESPIVMPNTSIFDYASGY